MGTNCPSLADMYQTLVGTSLGGRHVDAVVRICPTLSEFTISMH